MLRHAAVKSPTRLASLAVSRNHVGLLRNIRNAPLAAGESRSSADIFRETIPLLRQALKSRDLPTVRDYWSRLRDRNLSQYLGRSSLNGYSTLLAAIWDGDPHLPPTHLDEPSQKTLEEITLMAAVQGETGALFALFTSHLKCSNPRTVVELYDRYLQSQEAALPIQQDESEQTPNDALAPIGHAEEDVNRLGYVRLLLSVITAHAMQDSFDDALRTVVRNPLVYFPHLVDEILDPFIHDPHLQAKAKEYALRLDVARSVSRPASLAKRIQKYAELADNRLETFYNLVTEALFGRRPYIALTLAAVSPAKPVHMPENGWAAFITAFFTCGRRDLVERLWSDLHRSGVPITRALWTSLFNGFDSIRAVDDMLAGWDKMLKQGIKPDALAYRSLISTLFNGDRTNEAMLRFKAFRESRHKCPSSDAHVLVVFNTVIHHLLRQGHYEMAIAVLRTVNEEAVKPDLVTFNTFLRYYADRGDFKKVATTLRAIKKVGLVSDVVTWSTVLIALSKIGRHDAAEKVFNLMRDAGAEPTVVTYSGIINQLVREGGANQLTAAFDILKMMEEQPNTLPNVITYTSILSAVYRGECNDPDRAAECRRFITNRMKERGMTLDVTGYNTLLQACFENEEQEGMTRALGLYAEMVKQRMTIGNDTWFVLLKGLIGRGQWAVARELVQDMEVTRVRMGARLARLVAKVRMKSRGM
jgi:pentatricopeptide repeat protein